MDRVRRDTGVLSVYHTDVAHKYKICGTRTKAAFVHYYTYICTKYVLLRGGHDYCVLVDNQNIAGGVVQRNSACGEVGVSYASDVAVTVSPLVDKTDVLSLIATIASAKLGTFAYPADAMLVTTTADTVFKAIQYGD